MKLSKYEKTKQRDRMRDNFHKAIQDKDAKKVLQISQYLGLNFSQKQIEDLFNGNSV